MQQPKHVFFTDENMPIDDIDILFSQLKPIEPPLLWFRASFAKSQSTHLLHCCSRQPSRGINYLAWLRGTGEVNSVSCDVPPRKQIVLTLDIGAEASGCELIALKAAPCTSRPLKTPFALQLILKE